VSDRLERLRAALGSRVESAPEVLEAHRHDRWVLAEILDLNGRGAPRPLALLRPESTEEVARALGLCAELHLPVVTVGGASGVCGAVEATEECVVLSTRGLDGLRGIDRDDLLARFGAGTLGLEAERAVQAHGLTLGHWPQSVELSTVGGWVATRAAGQYSTGYGSIEDVVFALEVVLADGHVLRTRRTPRAAAGPDLRQLFLGSEGTLGVVTEVELSLRALPERSEGQAFGFSTFERAIETARRALREGWRPPVVRVYDAIESARQFGAWCPPDRCLLLLLHEGPDPLVSVQLDALRALAEYSQGIELEAAAVAHWLEHRNEVPSFRSLLERGLLVDTIEVGCTWTDVPSLYRDVIEALRSVPEVRLASAHTSHAYRSGTNLYFTFAARVEDRERFEPVYRACWAAAMCAADAHGAGLAHHHGIGRVRRAYLERELGSVGVQLLRSIKRALDPRGGLNPGALLPEP
jgi:alkyldihydroxyacetonephosphate synthase